MAKKSQSQSLDRKKFFADPIMVTTIVVLIVFLTLFILYPLAILLVDSVVSEGGGISLDVFKRVLAMPNFRRAISNTLKVGFLVGIASALIGLLFAYVEEYVQLKTKFMSGLFKVISMYPPKQAKIYSNHMNMIQEMFTITLHQKDMMNLKSFFLYNILK